MTDPRDTILAGGEKSAISFLTFDRCQLKPPITTNSVRKFDPAVVAGDAKSTRIVIHPRFPQLVQDFLAHKRQHGSRFEKALYGRPDAFGWRNEVRRLVEKRPASFVGSSDSTKLRDGGTAVAGARWVDEWDRNGREQQTENKCVTLGDYLSYDEMMLGSLLGVSGYSYFINSGDRHNRGSEGLPGTFEPRGIIIGLVGARVEREDRMDSVHILRSSVETPHQDPRLSKIFQDFFGAGKRQENRFDSFMYKKRIRITIDILLLEANTRAKDAGRSAHTYVVGLGLGVWKASRHQNQYYIEEFAAALQNLSLPHIRTLEFAFIDVDRPLRDDIAAVAAARNIKVIFSTRKPAEKLETDELLVLSYAWDSNAFPGNEYWVGVLSASGDPAAACMSTIGELHNPLINPFTERIHIVGSDAGI